MPAGRFFIIVLLRLYDGFIPFVFQHMDLFFAFLSLYALIMFNLVDPLAIIIADILNLPVQPGGPAITIAIAITIGVTIPIRWIPKIRGITIIRIRRKIRANSYT